MTGIAPLHEKEFGLRPSAEASAPGVGNLMGAHTEAVDGLVLLFGMRARASVAVTRRSDTSLRLFAPDLSERRRTSISALRLHDDGCFSALAKGVIERLGQLGARVGGVDISVSSEIPVGSGLGASQAIGTALALALGAVYRFPVDLLTAAQVAHHAEQRVDGTGPGLSGFLAAALSRRRTALLVDTHTLEWTYIDLDLNGHRLLGINTRAPSAQTREESARREADCELCLSVLSDRGHAMGLKNISLDVLYTGLGRVPEPARRHCLHVVGENERVLHMVDALRHRDFAQVGRLMYQSHESLRDLYEVSSPEVDWVVRHAGEIHGVYGARLAGGSRSSCALALVSRDAVAPLRERLRDYERIFGFHPDVLSCGTDDGARIDFREDV